MLTDEQKKAAERALFLRLPMFQNFEKERAFEDYKTAIAWIEKYNLPYRVSLEYLKQFDRSRGFIEINVNYPYPGYKVADLVHISPDNITLLDNLNMIPSEESLRQQIEEHNKKLRPWNLSTPEGRKKWRFYFAHFLGQADLQNYSSFDLFGKKEATSADMKRLDCWKALQADYHLSPDKYMNEEPRAADYDPKEYTQLEFIVDWDNNPAAGM